MDEVVIRFTEEDYNEYIEEWKKNNPRRRLLPVDEPMTRSLNKMLIITNRMVQNQKKHNMHDYVTWVLKKYNLCMLGIKSAELHVKFTYSTKIRRDIDNYLAGIKEILDPFVDNGLVVDDSYYYIHKITGEAEYQKGVTGMVFTFSNCVYDLDELVTVQEKERIRKEKRQATLDAKPKKKKKSKK